MNNDPFAPIKAEEELFPIKEDNSNPDFTINYYVSQKTDHTWREYIYHSKPTENYIIDLTDLY